jgi:hypothetical protein
MGNIKSYSKFTNENMFRTAVSKAASVVGIDTIKNELNDLLCEYSDYLNTKYEYYMKRKKTNEFHASNLTAVKDIERELYYTKSGEELAAGLDKLRSLRHETMGEYHIKLEDLRIFKSKNDMVSANLASEEANSLLQRVEYIDKILKKVKVKNVKMNEGMLISKAFDNTVVEPYLTWTKDDRLAIVDYISSSKLAIFEHKAKVISKGKKSGIDTWMLKKAELYHKWENIYDIDSLKIKEVQKKLSL